MIFLKNPKVNGISPKPVRNRNMYFLTNQNRNSIPKQHYEYLKNFAMYLKKNNGRFSLQYNEITLFCKFLWSIILIPTFFHLDVRVVMHCTELWLTAWNKMHIPVSVRFTELEPNWNDFGSGSGFG